MDKIRVVVIGHNFTSLLGIIRALGERNYEVGAIRTGKPKANSIWNRIPSPEEKSKYLFRYASVDSNDQTQMIETLLTRFAPEKGKAVIIPTDDITAEIVDQNMEKLKDSFFMPNINGQAGAIVKLMDKNYQKQLAKDSGLTVAEGWSVEIVEGKYELPKGVSYPCYVKPETPILKRKQFMKRCDAESELRDLLDSVAKYRDCKMLIEEYIEIEKEYSVVGLCNKEHVCIPAYIDMVVGGHGSHAGVTACGKLYAPGRFEEVTEKLKLMLSKLEYRGIYGVDLYESKGKIYFCELNTRMGASGVAVLLGGVNFADMFVRSLIDYTANIDYDQVCKEITFVNDKTCINDFGNSYISWKEYKSRMSNADCRFIYADSDRKPYYFYGVEVARYILRRIKKRIRFK